MLRWRLASPDGSEGLTAGVRGLWYKSFPALRQSMFTTAEVLYMLLQLPPKAEAVLLCNYESRVDKVCLGQVSQGLNRVPSSKCLRVPSLQST